MLTVAIDEGANSTVVVSESGRITFALQEERVSRKKNFIGFPHQALAFTLRHLGISPADIGTICFSNLISPIDTNASFLAKYEKVADADPESAIESGFQNAARRLYNRLPLDVVRLRNLMRGFDPNRRMTEALAAHGLGAIPVQRYHHHLAHAAGAYFGLRQNPRDPHLVLTLDGGGDHVCSQVFIGENGELRLIASTPNGHSVGNIYSRITHFMGMVPHEHEYKLMGMAAFAKEEYSEAAYQRFKTFLDLDPDNPLEFRAKIPELTTGGPAHLERIFKRTRFDNMAGGLQRFTEDLLIRWVQAAIKQTGIRKVVASGGVFMNVKANMLIANLPEVEYFDVFPSCGDESLPFGAAWLRHAETSPTRGADIAFNDCYLGPDAEYDMASARARFEDQLRFHQVDNPNEVVARLLARGAIVARCSGRMEFGARALGNRSILADADDAQVIPEINKMIKNRDFWMPFAPAVLREQVERYITVPASLPRERISPHMMFTFDSKVRRGEAVAGIHPYDRTARAQIVSREVNPALHDLMSRFQARTGKGLILNTSFNLHGFPIVMGAADAMEVMKSSALEYLVVGNHLMTKQPFDLAALMRD